MLDSHKHQTFQKRFERDSYSAILTCLTLACPEFLLTSQEEEAEESVYQRSPSVFSTYGNTMTHSYRQFPNG